MRNKKIPHTWFAWYPVQIRGKWVYFETVMRTWVQLDPAFGFWVYDSIVTRKSKVKRFRLFRKKEVITEHDTPVVK